jgi:hypothetical protein
VEMGLSTSKFFSDRKSASANHILQNFLSAKNVAENFVKFDRSSKENLKI